MLQMIKKYHVQSKDVLTPQVIKVKEVVDHYSQVRCFVVIGTSYQLHVTTNINIYQCKL